MHGSTSIAATAAELARREAFRLGDTLIAPASREVSGPGGQATIEPRVMQVLLALADAGGAVVTRDDLIRVCWHGQIVGEDAINRAVAEVRRVARTVGSGGFAVQTIPRTGYRLVGASASPAHPPQGVTAMPASDAASRTSRRVLFGAAALGVIGAGGVVAWALWPDGKARRAADLAAQARLAMINDTPSGYEHGVALLRQAVALTPRDPGLLGKLAMALRTMSDFASPAQTAAIVQSCELAATRAFALDPRQPDARLALALLRPTYGDWLIVERKLRVILADAPGHVETQGALAFLLKSVGRDAEAFAVNEQAAAREPLSPIYQYRRMYHLWSMGRLGEADRAIDRAIELWPRHSGVWLARLWLSAFTGRAGAALAQVNDAEARPAIPQDGLGLLRLSMEAIETRRPATVAAAAAANVAAARTGPGGSINSMLILAGLGRMDDAFAVAEGYLLRRGPNIMPLRFAPTQMRVSDQTHRKTQMLFVPVTAPLRADPRFIEICRGCGLADYWRQSGHWADFLGSRRIA